MKRSVTKTKTSQSKSRAYKTRTLQAAKKTSKRFGKAIKGLSKR